MLFSTVYTILLLLLNTVFEVHMIRRFSGDITDMFEKQQGFTDMGRLRQGKHVVGNEEKQSKENKKMLRDGEEAKKQEDENPIEISQLMYVLFSPNIKTGNENDTLNQENHTAIETIIEKKLEETTTKKPTNVTNSTSDVYDINKIRFLLVKVWCTTQIEGDFVVKITRCVNDEESLNKIKYMSKVYLNNKPNKTYIPFFRCVGRIKVHEEGEDFELEKNQEQLQACFNKHNITEKHLSDFLDKKITPKQRKDLTAFYECVNNGSDEDLTQTLSDCIEVDPILFEITDRMTQLFQEMKVTSAPQMLKSGKSFNPTNIKDFTSEEEENLKFNFKGALNFDKNDEYFRR